MFSTLKLKQRREGDQVPKKKPSKKTTKWSLEKAWCRGGAGTGAVSDDGPPTLPRSSSRTSIEQTTGEGTVVRVVSVSLERDESCGLGISLRGGVGVDGVPRPVVVTQVRPASPADREGSLRVGDRLLSVNGRPVAGLALAEVERAVRVPLVWLTVEYDVSVLAGLRAAGPIVVDIESPPGSAPKDIGLTLTRSQGKMFVAAVRPASLAERCGALLPGDQIMAVNEKRIDGTYTPEEVVALLTAPPPPLLQIEIQPVPSASLERVCPSPTWSQGSGGSQRSLYEGGQRSGRPSPRRSPSPSTHHHPPYPPTERSQELKTERGVVTLHAMPGRGLGLSLRWVPSKMAAVVADVEPNGPADRSGVVQIGDRVRSVNGNSVSEAGLTGGGAASLEVEFDVEVHPPAAPGTTAVVHLARSPASGFGVTINGSAEYPSAIVVSRLRWGSVAHRCGRLSVGDHLLAIGETRLGGDIRLATAVLKACPHLVSFTVLKHPGSVDLGYSSSGLPSLDSAVEPWSGPDLSHHSDCNDNHLEDWKERLNRSLRSLAIQQSGEVESCEAARVVGMGKPPPSPPCPLQTNYRLRNNIGPKHWRQSSSITNSSDPFADLEALEEELRSAAAAATGPTFQTFRGHEGPARPAPRLPLAPTTTLTVSLYKDPVYEDFGFSVSDGLYERGVFINRIRPGGPADLCRALRPFDRIVQVNDTRTEEMDCCVTVPLVASSPDPLVLTVCRGRTAQPHLQEEEEERVGWVEVGVEAQLEPVPSSVQGASYQTL